MDKYIGDILEYERDDTRNSDTLSIPNAQLLRYNQAAQDRLYNLVSLSHNYAFEKEIEIDIEANKSEYSINDYLAYGTRITAVFYSHDGNSDSYRQLYTTPNRYKRFEDGTKPRYYRRRQGLVVLEPTPEQALGKIKVVYERSMDRLALRSGYIDDTPSGSVIDLVDADSLSGAIPSDEQAKMSFGNYVCVTSQHGEQLLYNAPIAVAGYSYVAKTLTVQGNVSDYLVSGKSLGDLEGAYLTVGKWTTTHSDFPNEAEPYFIEYVNRKLHAVDSSDQFADTDQMLQELAESIVAAYRLPDKEIHRIPTDDFDLFIPGYD